MIVWKIEIYFSGKFGGEFEQKKIRGIPTENYLKLKENSEKKYLPSIRQHAIKLNGKWEKIKLQSVKWVISHWIYRVL